MTSRPSSEQLLIQVLMRSSQQVLRVLSGSKDVAPQRTLAESELELAFAPIWSRLPFLELTCFENGLRWNSQEVLTPKEDEFGLARTLITSGIHGVTFVPGVERIEMLRFLELVDRKRRLDEAGDQDLVLMLFRADLHHIRYTVGPPDVTPLEPAGMPRPAEVLQPAGVPRKEGGEALIPDVKLDLVSSDGDDPIEADALSVAVRRDAGAEAEEGRGVVQLEKFDSTLYFLDQREIEYLRSAINREYSQDQTLNVVSLLLDILQLRSDPEVRDEVLGVLGTMLPYLLGAGHFESVAYLTRELRKITRDASLAPRHKKAVDAIRGSVSRAGALTQLFHVLDDGGVQPTAEELGVLLRELRHEALQTVLVWIGQLRHPDTKTALVAAVELFFTEWPAALSRMTTAADRTVVHRALAIATKLQLPEFTDPVVDALKSEDPTSRRLAVSALAAIGGAPALRSVADAVDDRSAEVRVAACTALASRPFRGAHKALLRGLTADDLESRELSERRILFTAFGSVAGPGGVSTLQPVLLGKGGLARRPSAGTRACAAVALGLINTPAARLALEHAASDKDPLVRSAAGAALRGEGSLT